MTALARARLRVADGYLQSATSEEGHSLSMDEVERWLEAQRAAQPIVVSQVPLRELTDWAFEGAPLRLAHRSHKFFAVEGLRVATDFGPVTEWDQPILHQPEIGILGIVTKVFGGVRHFLMQAKVEPGNINGVQLSPTVQATHSNYSRVHGGHRPAFLDYFLDHTRGRVIVDQLQGEQGARYLRKQNRNMIVEVRDEIEHDDRFCWMTLGQIKRLLRSSHLVNMDTRTVLACLPLLDRDSVHPAPHGAPRPVLIGDLPLGPFARDLLDSVLEPQRQAHSMRELLHWLTDLRARYRMHLLPVGLDALDGWVSDDLAITHRTGRHFSVIGVAVESVVREVSRWQQPLLAHDGYGLNGFVVQRVNGVLHFLVRACMYPGNTALFELGSTVSRSNADDCFGQPDAPPFLDLFQAPPSAWVRYSAIQSEEGGRFYRYQNRYVILEVPEGHAVANSAAHRWMTLLQVQELVQHGYFNIEGRNLLACLDLCGTWAR